MQSCDLTAIAASLPPAGTPHFIDNLWTASAGGAFVAVKDSATEELLATLPEASATTVDLAFDAAHRAFPSWSSKSGAERAEVLKAIAAGVQARYDELARLESHMGKPLSESKWDMDDVIHCFQMYADQAIALDAKQGTPITVPDADYSCHMRYESMGVVACIVPWNYPLLVRIMRG